MSDRSRGQLVWASLAMLVIVGSALAVRWGTNLLEKENVRDEYLMRVPIDNILDSGWSTETAIDYQEVKGPAFFWSYALPCELLGQHINDMRLVSVLFFIGAGAIVLIIGLWGGLRGWQLPAIGALYVLLPYNLPQGQLLMSEASFLFYAGLTTLAFLWGFGATTDRERRLWGPILVAITLSVLLHHRPHGVALAGAVALVSLGRDGIRCWPWWLACVAAGISRLPLWARWGGLVTSDYQGIFGMGLSLDALTYLLIVTLPVAFVFLWPALKGAERRTGRWWTGGGAALGLLLCIAAMPDLDARMEFTVQSTGKLVDVAAFAGIIATAIDAIAGDGVLRSPLLLLLSTAGGGALGAFAHVVARRRAWDAQAAITRFAFWTLATGLPLYVVTRGPVYDRYVLVWLLLMPIVWVLTVPRWLLVVQAVLLAAINAYFIYLYFI